MYKGSSFCFSSWECLGVDVMKVFSRTPLKETLAFESFFLSD